MKINDVVEVEIIDDNHNGNGIAKIDSLPIFIPKTMKKDIVKIKIEKLTKKYAVGQIIEFIKQSNEREKINCPYYDKCGGCNLLHLSYEQEKKLKKSYIEKIFKKENIKITSFERNSYRNKVTLHVKNNKLGYYSEKTNDIIEIKKCLLLDNEINEIIPYIEKINLTKIEEIVIKKAEKGLLLSVKGKIYDKDKEYLSKNKNILSIFENNNLIKGKKYLETKIGNKEYLINNNSFFQVNEKCTKALYDKIKQMTGQPNTLLDLYCGIASIGLYLEDIKTITGLEINEDSVKCAKENIKKQNIKNYNIILKDAKYLEKKFESVIVDPPRSGLSKQVITKLNNMKSKKIIYISCNPSTLKRDIELLKNYELKEIEIFNMFPATKHIECISKLCLKDDNTKYNPEGGIS